MLVNQATGLLIPLENGCLLLLLYKCGSTKQTFLFLVSLLVCRGPPWCSIVGATVTVHQFFCILHYRKLFIFRCSFSNADQQNNIITCLFRKWSFVVAPFQMQINKTTDLLVPSENSCLSLHISKMRINKTTDLLVLIENSCLPLLLPKNADQQNNRLTRSYRK